MTAWEREYWQVQIGSFNCEHRHRAYKAAFRCALKWSRRMPGFGDFDPERFIVHPHYYT